MAAEMSGGVLEQSTIKFGFTSVRGPRPEMEDAVSTHPALLDNNTLHYFAVFDGHGCWHVAEGCKRSLHTLLKQEIAQLADLKFVDWKTVMNKTFQQIDDQLSTWNEDINCGCTPNKFNEVGSTAVVAIVTRHTIVVANCGDSRAILCRNGKAVALSEDHKPDRPDELHRIETAGGRVLYWQGARVDGVLAMSRAIGDNYLKPYVTCEPEVTITKRTADDEFLILASDGLWDVVSNETACRLVRMSLNGNGPSGSINNPPLNEASGFENCNKACSDASLLLTKRALARQSGDNVSVVVVDLR